MNFDHLEQLQKKIGYKFKDKALFIKSLTHPSVSADSNNQLLEYLGDSLLDFLVAEYLYNLNPDMEEGVATKKRSEMVSKWPLAKIYDELGLVNCIDVFNVNKHDISDKFKSDFVESVLGAIYIDGGIENARKFVLRFICNTKPVAESKDFKSKLYEYAAKHQLKVRFDDDKSGEPHKQHFYSTVYIDEIKCGYGEGDTKKEAQQEASSVALEKIKKCI